MQAVLHSQAACAFCPAERRASWTARPASPKDWRSLCRDRCFPPAKTSVPRLEDGSPVPGRPYPVLSFSHEPGRKTCFPPRKRTAWRARYSPGPAGHPPRKRTDPKKGSDPAECRDGAGDFLKCAGMRARFSCRRHPEEDASRRRAVGPAQSRQRLA